MKYKCLVFDHDDTTVNSTASIHYPCFIEYLEKFHPEKTCSLKNYFLKNFHPGFIEMCQKEYDITDNEFERETEFWRSYVKERIPIVYPGIKNIMEKHKAEGGIICVVSHSFEDNILRDYSYNGLPTPDAVYGWSRPVEERKPYSFPLIDIMKRFSLKNSDILMIDDLKPGYDMSLSCNVDFAAAGWANDIEEIESFMRLNSNFYFKTVNELDKFLF